MAFAFSSVVENENTKTDNNTKMNDFFIFPPDLYFKENRYFFQEKKYFTLDRFSVIIRIWTL